MLKPPWLGGLMQHRVGDANKVVGELHDDAAVKRGRLIVYVIDDDDALRDAARGFLADEGFDVQTYASASEFRSKLEAISFGCIVTDVSMPGMSGIELLSYIASQGLALPAIVITGHADVPLAVRAMKHGAVDFLEKPFRADRLIGAIRQAVERGRGSQTNQAMQEAKTRLAALSSREREVLVRLIRGQRNSMIADGMGISPRTVEVHRANVMKKTQAGSLPELVRIFRDVDHG